MAATPKIAKGTVTIDGVLYKAFEMFENGPWMIVAGQRYSDPVVIRGIKARSGKQAIEAWLAGRDA